MQDVLGEMMRFLILLIFINFVFAMEPIVPIPKTTEYNKQKALLGKRLYFDPILSADNKVSCASCHSPEFAGADNKQFSVGVFGRIDEPMNSPTSYNAVFNCWQFWNGRAKDLKEQAEMANQDHNEMGMTPKKVEEKINKNKEYKKLFKKIYNADYITYGMIFDAIAEFEKALITPDCKFDRYLRGEEDLNEKEKKGYFLFKSYGCITCHNGVNLGGNSFQKMGVMILDKNIPRGRDRFEVTKNSYDKYVYKVPTLRNIELTAPYFHNGSVKTLKEAIKKMAYYNLGIVLKEDEIDAIESFLKTLTGKKPEILEENE